MPRLVILSLAILLAGSPLVAGEFVVEIASRGQNARALLLTPEKAPVGSVILLAGGHGNLNLRADGRIRWGADNHLVRSRALYAAAGFNTLVPDIAPDLKLPDGGVVDGYRADSKNATDIGAAVAYMRTLRSPVVLIGTSRGSISAANAAARLTGPARPDAVVVSSAFLGANPRDFSVAKMAGNDPRRLNLPLLVIEHRADGCGPTGPTAVEPFRAWYEAGGRRLDILWLEGGDPPRGDPCEARGAHGFPGLDDRVVADTAAWIAGLRLAR